MYYDVFKFNQKRNEFKFDEELETDMRTEEINEFFEAKTLAEMLDAYVDTNYVWFGTKMKAVKSGIVIGKELINYMDNVFALMLDIMRNRIEQANFALDMWELIEESEKIVCEINNEKISKLDKNGKVMKQKTLRDATKEIAEMLKEYGIEE